MDAGSVWLMTAKYYNQIRSSSQCQLWFWKSRERILIGWLGSCAHTLDHPLCLVMRSYDWPSLVTRPIPWPWLSPGLFPDEGVIAQIFPQRIITSTLQENLIGNRRLNERKIHQRTLRFSDAISLGSLGFLAKI